MLNILSSDVPIHMEYQEEIRQFLMNALVLTIARKEKNYQDFAPEIKEAMKENPTWLEENTEWLQGTVITSLEQSGNYGSLEEILKEFDTMVSLYQQGHKVKPTPSEAGQFITIHDKWLVILLSDEALLKELGLLK